MNRQSTLRIGALIGAGLFAFTLSVRATIISNVAVFAAATSSGTPMRRPGAYRIDMDVDRIAGGDDTAYHRVDAAHLAQHICHAQGRRRQARRPCPASTGP